MNILLLLAHSIAEYDDCRMFSDMGHNVFSIGAYTTPWTPSDNKRPPLEQMSYLPEFERLVGDQMAAKANLPQEIIDWADVIICHHYLDRWIVPQWDRLRHKRVIWRTCGQSDDRLEDLMEPLRDDGLTIVRYSPAEQVHFERSGHWAGADALIRFGKYVDDYGPWDPQGAPIETGVVAPWVANLTQDMAGRGEWCGLSFYLAATQGLEAHPAGGNSEILPGGIGTLGYPEMLAYLRHAGAYLYTGTHPASYTLGLIEAMLSGVPTVSIGAERWMGPALLFEAATIAGLSVDNPIWARDLLMDLLTDEQYAREVSEAQVGIARQLFDVEKIKPQWAKILS